MQALLHDLLSQYGISVEDIIVEDVKGIMHKLSFSGSKVSVLRNADKTYRAHKAGKLSDVDPSDRDLIWGITALLDDYFVSNAFWQELSHRIQTLPRLRLINEFRDEVDMLADVVETPGMRIRTQVSFLSDLEHLIRDKCKKEQKKSVDRASYW